MERGAKSSLSGRGLPLRRRTGTTFFPTVADLPIFFRGARGSRVSHGSPHRNPRRHLQFLCYGRILAASMMLSPSSMDRLHLMPLLHRSLHLIDLIRRQRGPVGFFMIAGQVSDHSGAGALWDGLPKAEWRLADRGHDADWLREASKDKVSTRTAGYLSIPATSPHWPVPCDARGVKAAGTPARP